MWLFPWEKARKKVDHCGNCRERYRALLYFYTAGFSTECLLQLFLSSMLAWSSERGNKHCLFATSLFWQRFLLCLSTTHKNVMFVPATHQTCTAEFRNLSPNTFHDHSSVTFGKVWLCLLLSIAQIKKIIISTLHRRESSQNFCTTRQTFIKKEGQQSQKVSRGYEASVSIAPLFHGYD